MKLLRQLNSPFDDLSCCWGNLCSSLSGSDPGCTLESPREFKNILMPGVHSLKIWFKFFFFNLLMILKCSNGEIPLSYGIHNSWCVIHFSLHIQTGVGCIHLSMAYNKNFTFFLYLVLTFSNTTLISSWITNNVIVLFHHYCFWKVELFSQAVCYLYAKDSYLVLNYVACIQMLLWDFSKPLSSFY